MYKNLSLQIIAETMESFDQIISEIEAKFKYYSSHGTEFVDELIDIATEYRSDVVVFLQSLHVMIDKGGFNEILPSANEISKKLIRLDDIIDTYAKQPITQFFFEEPQTKLYS